MIDDEFVKEYDQCSDRELLPSSGATRIFLGLEIRRYQTTRFRIESKLPTSPRIVSTIIPAIRPRTQEDSRPTRHGTMIIATARAFAHVAIGANASPVERTSGGGGVDAT